MLNKWFHLYFYQDRGSYSQDITEINKFKTIDELSDTIIRPT